MWASSIESSRISRSNAFACIILKDLTQPIHVDAVLFVGFGVPVASVVSGLCLGGLSGLAKWPSMHLTPHHAKLHEQIRALEGGEVQTATGRSKCLVELKKALAARQFYWGKVLEVGALNDRARAYVHEDLAFNWDLGTYDAELSGKAARG